MRDKDSNLIYEGYQRHLTEGAWAPYGAGQKIGNALQRLNPFNSAGRAQAQYTGAFGQRINDLYNQFRGWAATQPDMTGKTEPTGKVLARFFATQLHTNIDQCPSLKQAQESDESVTELASKIMPPIDKSHTSAADLFMQAAKEHQKALENPVIAAPAPVETPAAAPVTKPTKPRQRAKSKPQTEVIKAIDDINKNIMQSLKKLEDYLGKSQAGTVVQVYNNAVAGALSDATAKAKSEADANSENSNANSNKAAVTQPKVPPTPPESTTPPVEKEKRVKKPKNKNTTATTPNTKAVA